MTDIAELGLAVRSDGVVIAKDRLRDFTKEAGLAEKVTASLITRAGQLVGAYATWRVAEGFINKFVSSTVEAEKAQERLATVVKSTGAAAGLTVKELTAMAGALQDVTSYGDEAIMSAQGVLLQYQRIGREVFPEALEAVLNMSAAMGTDLVSAAERVGKAIDTPSRGMAALAKQGFFFTEEQEKVVKSLEQTGRLMEAQKIVLKELELAYGGSARAARGTLGGALQALKEAFGDLFEANGPASEQLRQNVERLISTITDPNFIQSVQNLGIAMFKAFNDALSKIDEIIMAVQTFFAQWTDPVLSKMRDQGTTENAEAYLAKRLTDRKFMMGGQNAWGEDMGSFFKPFRSDGVGEGATHQGVLSAMGLYKPPGSDPGVDDATQKQLDAYDKVTEAANRRIEQMRTEAEAATMVGYAGEALTITQQLMADAEKTGIELTDKRIQQLTELADKQLDAQIAIDGAQTTLSNRTVWEQAADDIAKLNAQLDAGAISWDTYARAAGSTMANALSATFGALSGLSGALEQVFEDNKAFSIATAVLKGAESIASSYAAGSAIGGPPVGIIFAGIAAATAALNVASVASTNRNSKSISGGGGGGAGAATPLAQVPAASTTVINLQGSSSDTYSQDSIKKLLETIGKVGQDNPGMILKVVSTANG